MTINKRKILLLLGDILLLYLSLFLALLLRWQENFQWQIFFQHFFPFSLLYFFWITIFYISGLYDFDLLKNKFIFFTRLLGSLIASLISSISLFYFLPIFGITPKINLFLVILISGFFILCWRKIFFNLFSSYFQKKLAILGKSKEAEELALAIKENPHLGYKFFNFLDTKKDFINILRKEKIEILVLAENIFTKPELINLLYQSLPLLKLEIFNLSQFYELVFEKVPVSAINQFWFLENLKEKKKEFYEKTKRIIDFILAFFLFLITLPFWPLIILAIKLEDKGKAFYLQERVGKDKKIFKLIKFRSMIERAEKNGPQWAESEDQRITKVGRFLRKTHLDEIPQLINIIKGDISLVGPRPERPEFVKQLEKEIPHYHLRHIIKPGFTGWAQIKFRYARSVMDSFEKFQYDLFYIKNRSFFLDFKILLKTFQLFFKKEK